MNAGKNIQIKRSPNTKLNTVKTKVSDKRVRNTLPTTSKKVDVKKDVRKEQTFIKDKVSVQNKQENVSSNLIEVENSANVEVMEPKTVQENCIDHAAHISNQNSEKMATNEFLAAKVAIKTQAITEKRKNDGYFTEVITHGVFRSPKCDDDITIVSKTSKMISSANEVALEAKSFLELDRNMSAKVKAAVIEKLFDLADMVYRANDAKHRVQAEFDKFKERSYRDRLKIELEHSTKLAEMQRSSNENSMVLSQGSESTDVPSDNMVDLRIYEDSEIVVKSDSYEN